MMTRSIAHDFLTLAEAAEAARISRRYLQAHLQRCKDPPITRLGRRLIIRREALQAWLVSREVSHASA